MKGYSFTMADTVIWQNETGVGVSAMVLIKKIEF